MSTRTQSQAARLLLLSSEFPPGPGGIGTHAHQLALQLHQRGWQVTVLSPQEYVEQAQVERFDAAQPFEVVQLRQLDVAPPLKAAYRFYRASELVRRVRPSVVIASGERMVWVGAALTRPFHVPLVAIGHAMEFNVPQRWNRAVNRATYGSAAGIICVSEYTADQMRQMGVHPPRLAVIPNGADEGRFHPVEPSQAAQFRQRHGLGTGPLLITVGSVHERKGQDVVVRAMPEILRAHPDAHYVSCGLPMRRDTFVQLARDLGVVERVHFLGIVEHAELLAALSAADVFVMASQHTANGDFEGYGIAAVEAALCGKPAVVSDGSGLVEAIAPGTTGLVAHRSDPGSTAAQVIALLDDSQRRITMGEAARRRALGEQTWSRRGDEFDAFLRDVVAPVPHAARGAA